MVVWDICSRLCSLFTFRMNQTPSERRGAHLNVDVSSDLAKRARDEDDSRTSTSLLIGARSHDAEAWRRLFQTYAPMVYRWCRRAGLHQDAAADVGQEVFASAARRIGDFRHDRAGDSMRKWLRAITSNKIHDFWRAGGGEQSQGGTSWLNLLHQLGQPDDSSASSLRTALRKEDLRLAAIEQVRAEASQRDWQIFEHIVIDERLPADVARQLGVPVNTVYLVKSRMLKRARQCFVEMQKTDR